MTSSTYSTRTLRKKAIASSVSSAIPQETSVSANVVGVLSRTSESMSGISVRVSYVAEQTEDGSVGHASDARYEVKSSSEDELSAGSESAMPGWERNLRARHWLNAANWTLSSVMYEDES